MILIFDDLMLAIIDDIHPVEHPVVGLHEDLVPVLVKPHLINLGLIDDEVDLREVVEVEGGWQEEHRVRPHIGRSQSVVGETSGREGSAKTEFPIVRSLIIRFRGLIY